MSGIRGYLPSGVAFDPDWDTTHCKLYNPQAVLETACETCGKPIRMGWTANGSYYCNAHELDAGDDRGEFRTCEYCGRPMEEGMTNLEGFYVHEGECFHEIMHHTFVNGYCMNDHAMYPLWEDGFWDYLDEDGIQEDTGIFFTHWH